jgi:serine protease inhibitor
MSNPSIKDRIKMFQDKAAEALPRRPPVGPRPPGGSGPSSQMPVPGQSGPTMVAQNQVAGLEYLVKAINEFGSELQARDVLVKEKSAMAYSNIYHCLLLLVAGAQGESLKALAKTLRFESIDKQKLFEDFCKLDAYIKSASEVEMLTAASVWHVSTVILEPAFKSTMEDTFKSDFGPIRAGQINEWTIDKTKGKITASFTQADLQGVDVMLISCLYFKALWADPFEKNLTVAGMFSSFDNESKSCNMMRRNKKTQYWEDDDSQICFLPYKCGTGGAKHPQWQAALILPKTAGKASIETVFNAFIASPQTLHAAQSRASSNILLDLSLPRFSFELNISLNQPLAEIGLGPIFAASDDFSLLTKSFPLGVSQVTHDLFIQVNEEGTEVAARTVVMMKRSMAVAPPRKVMTLDRPFIFTVFDSISKLILCSAVVDGVDAFEKGPGEST